LKLAVLFWMISGQVALLVVEMLAEAKSCCQAGSAGGKNRGRENCISLGENITDLGDHFNF